MLYCPNCHLLVADDQCPICDTRDLRHPTAADYCFVAEEAALWAPPLADLFRDNAIPFVTQSAVSAALTAKFGTAMERTRFYVPYGYYPQAKMLTDEFFSADPIFEE